MRISVIMTCVGKVTEASTSSPEQLLPGNCLTHHEMERILRHLTFAADDFGSNYALEDKHELETAGLHLEGSIIKSSFAESELLKEKKNISVHISLIYKVTHGKKHLYSATDLSCPNKSF